MGDGARRMFRYTVPVNGQPWMLALTVYAVPVHVAVGATLDEVDFWAEHADGAPERARWFQVFGTGHPLPPGACYVGTTARDRGLVWHLYEIVTEVSDG
jgi:hypothetical protein